MSQPYRSAPDDAALALPVRTGELGRPALRFGASVWALWSLAGALTALGSSGFTLAALGITLAFGAVGAGPAALAAHWAAERSRRWLRLTPSAVLAEAAPLLDLDAPLEACVLELGDVQHLVALQEGRWLILSGQGLRSALGGQAAWGERWNELRLVQLRHRELELGLEAFAPAWALEPTRPRADSAPPGREEREPSCSRSERSAGRRVVGGVGPSPELGALAARLRERAAATTTALVLPTAHPVHGVIRATTDGTLDALGARLDAARALLRTPIWASRARSEADALVLTQGEVGVCLSLSLRPGAGPGPGGGFVPSTPELPGPALPPEEVVLPVVLAAVDGWLSRWQRGEARAPGAAG